MKLLLCVLTLGFCLVSSHSSGEHIGLGDPFLKSCFEKAKTIVDDAYKYSRDVSVSRVRRAEAKPHDILRLMKQPRGETRSAARSADYMSQTLRLLQERVHHAHKLFVNTTDLLSEEQLRNLISITGCAATTREPSCRTIQNLDRYRTITGVCNNLKRTRLGASNTAFIRLLPGEYEDGIEQPQGWDKNRRVNNFVLPLVRAVSNNILKTLDKNVVNDGGLTFLTTMFGQWNDHDITFSPFSASIRSFANGINCEESCERTEPCFPIEIPRGDPSRRPGPDSCIPTFRSAPVCGTGVSAFNFGGEPNKREQMNALTAFLDLSQVYGSNDKLALSLRDLTSDGGLLRVNKNFTDSKRELLPFLPLTARMARLCFTRRRITNDNRAQEVPCNLAGDMRVNENIVLTSLHTLFLREHNRLARELKRINPQWDSETLYQEARKIMGAYTQVIVFQDYLRHIVGDDFARLLAPGRYPGYDPNVDPSISNVFSTAAYRFGHLTVQPILPRLDANFREDKRLPGVPLFQAFFTPWRIIFEGGIDPVIRGLVGRPAKLNTQDAMMVDAIRDRLFQFAFQLALDLGSLNMQRAREHGLPRYNAWRRFCRLSEPRNERELAVVLNNTQLARSLLQLYGTPANIDAWIGGVAEPFVRGGRVGPLFACLIGTQFLRIRQGDRLWWQNPGVFTPQQRAALQFTSLARIICDNTGINNIQSDVFRPISQRNRLIRCQNVRQVRLSAWRERPRHCTEDPQGLGCKVEGSGSETNISMDKQHPLENEVTQE